MAGKQADIKIGVITNYDDKGLKNAQTGLAGFKSSIADADGVGGKFKAGWGSIKESVTQNVGAMALAGGAALVAFGVKAVGAFTETAKAALDLGKATGLSTEEASRWIAVGDDMGVSAETLTTALGKIGKTLDGSQWEKYGVATRDAGGEARSTNDILLDSLDRLGKITNETERAKAGNALFGKGYASLSPLIGKTRNEMEKYLGEVERGQVITTQEAEKAEKFRLAQDQLGDALKDVTIAVGQQVAALAPYLSMLAKIVVGIQGTEVHKELVDTFEALAPLNDEIRAGGHDIEYWLDQIGKGKLTLDEAIESIHDATLSTDQLALSQKEQAAQTAETARENRKLPVAWEETRDAEEEATAAATEYKNNAADTARSVKQNIDEMIGKWNELTGDVEDDKAWLTLQGQFDELRIKAEEAYTAAATGAVDAEAKSRDYQIGVKDLILDTVNYGKTVADLPPEKLVAIKAAIDMGDIDRAEEMLAILTRNRDVNLSIVTRGGAGYNQLGTPSYASGTARVPGARGQPMLAVVHGGETITENGGNAGGGPTNVTIMMPVGSNGDDVIRAIKKWENRNGPGWRS